MTGVADMERECTEIIYVPDTYRRTGRGKTGMEMHYTRQQCSRKANDGTHCWQHAKRCRGVHVD